MVDVAVASLRGDLGDQCEWWLLWFEFVSIIVWLSLAVAASVDVETITARIKERRIKDAN